jgi:hypothetical protein
MDHDQLAPRGPDKIGWKSLAGFATFEDRRCVRIPEAADHWPTAYGEYGITTRYAWEANGIVERYF